MAKTRIDLSAAGVTLKYAVETTAGTRPTTGYTKFSGLKSTPSLNPQPEAIDATTLDETEYKVYVEGLKDLGGSLEFGFNMTQELVDQWDKCLTAYETGIAAKKQMWFEISIPGITKSLFFTGKPSAMGLPETGVDALLECSNYITPTNEPAFYEKATD